MNKDFQLKLQAYLDEELSEQEVREVEAALDADAGARGLLTELRHTSWALRTFEADVKLPESREFFWSKVRREIARQEKPAAVAVAPVPFWRRFLIPAGGFAALAIVVMLGLRPASGTSPRAVAVETVLTDSEAVTYRDASEGMTLVWLSYPAGNQLADANFEDILY